MTISLLCPSEQWGVLVRELLAARQPLRLRLRGSSMYPVIHNHDIAHIQPVSPGDIEPGAVVFYVVGQHPIIHRVVRQRDDHNKPHFLICADASGKGHWVAAEQIFGKVVAIERNGRTLSLQGWRGQMWGWRFSRLWRGASAVKQALMTHHRR